MIQQLQLEDTQLPVSTQCRWWTFDQLTLGLGKAGEELRLDYSYATPEGLQPGWHCFGPLQSRRLLVGANSLQLAYKLADRAIVARLSTSLTLPPRSQSRFWVSSALWVCLQSNDETLLELPAARLSDTWFGPNTRRGELCYAARSKARPANSASGNSTSKAITPVTIVNQSEDMLVLEKINLPVVNLALYRLDKQFWTTAIQVERGQATAELKVTMAAGPPAEAAEAIALQPPRQPVPEGVLYKAKDWLLG